MSDLRGNRGVVLVIVLGVLLISVILASVVLNIIRSHSRLTHHQLSRIQAYYAGMGAINYALNQLYKGNFVAGTDCRPAGAADPRCVFSRDSETIDPSFAADFPQSLRSVRIVIRTRTDAGCNPPAGINTCVGAVTEYSYTQ